MWARLAGYQGADSVLTAGLAQAARALRSRGLSTKMEADVTAAGGTARGLFDTVEAGTGPQLCYLASGYLAERVPALAALDLPYAAPGRERLFAALDGAAGQIIRAELEARTGLVLLGFWDNGMRHISNGRRPLRAPADCQGLIIRTLDNATYQAALAAMGFRPVVTDVLQLRAAVASGAVDAQENPLTNLLGFGLQAHHRFLSLTGHIQGVVLLVANAGWYLARPVAERRALHDAAAAATALQRGLASAEDARALSVLQQEGVAVLGPDDIDLAGFRAACAPVAETAAARLDPNLLASLR